MPIDPTLTITLTVKFDKDGHRKIPYAQVQAASRHAVDVATDALTQGLTREGVTPQVTRSGAYTYEWDDPLASE